MTEGEHFHGYLVERLVGKGAYGAVYQVRHEVLGTTFALKVLDPSIVKKGNEDVRRFIREAKLASRLHHPSLVAVHDAGYDGERGAYYIVMDYVQGETLRTAIALGGGMQEREAVRIIGDVASALDAAAALGMVHRDIKPENILLMPDDTVKLIDLGIAKAGSEVDSLRTMAKSVFGTPAYMSPEQAADSSAVDTRSDIYSLGVVFFEMLCGRSPYKASSPEAVVQELLSQDPLPDVRTFNSKVSVKTAAVLSLMCAKRIEDRLESPAALLSTLARLGYDVPAPLESMREQTDSDEDSRLFYDILHSDACRENVVSQKYKGGGALAKVLLAAAVILVLAAFVFFLLH